MSRKCAAGIGRAIMALVMSGILLTGCGSSLSESDVPYAGPLLDNILAAIAERDYVKFSKDFSDQMKAAIPEEDFISLASTLDAELGDYEEKNFSNATPTNSAGLDLMIVSYQARYSMESGVKITIYFSDKGGEKSIEGFSIDSPSLQP